tara:strand:+ start:459 stop:1004 length:546 start_codon:yes stop_codon:yes gene_type:complete
MPKKEMDYSKCCVYKICCNDISVKDCYVGSTTNLVQRRRAHKNICNNEKDKGYNYYVYKFIRNNGGWNNWGVVLVQEYPDCKCREELLKFERHHTEILGATLNKQVQGRTKEEYYQDNKESLLKKNKVYHQNNKEKRNEYSKEYHQNNNEKIECEFCKSLVRKCNIARHQKSLKCLAEQNK